MSPLYRRSRIRPVVLSVAILVLTLMASCTTVVDHLSEALYPTRSLGPTEPSSRTVKAATSVTQATSQPTLAPTRTPVSQVNVSPTLGPPPEEGQYLVFCRGGSIYRGGYFGEDATEVASVPPLEAWDFWQGLLATTQGTNLDIIDLKKGSLASFQVATGTKVEYAEVVWGTLGTVLLHAAVVSDAAAPIFERSVQVRALSPGDGAEIGKILVRSSTMMPRMAISSRWILLQERVLPFSLQMGAICSPSTLPTREQRWSSMTWAWRVGLRSRVGTLLKGRTARGTHGRPTVALWLFCCTKARRPGMSAAEGWACGCLIYRLWRPAR